jgi:tripartite-type tricarboxylate transporter receptor subunit TctC
MLLHARSQRRRATRALLAGLLSAAAWPFDRAVAQDAGGYPARPIKIVVGFAPGGATDVVARLFAQKLQALLGQPVVVENKAGAGSNLATEQVARAAPDGYTLLLATIANATNLSIYKNLGYDTLRDFAPIIHLMSAPSVLVVGPAVPASDLKELIALAKRKPGELTFASSGAGGSPHLAGEMLKIRAGIDLVHVPYKGAAPAMADVIGGTVTMGFKTALSAIPQMQAGKVKPIAVAATRRLAQIPDVPTFAELGLPNFEVSSWNGLVAPAKTPAAVVETLNRACQTILAMPDIREKFAAQAAETVGGSPEQFTQYIRAEIERWAQVVRVSGAKVD